MLLDPGHHPLRRDLFRQRARAGIVGQDLAGAPGAELGQQLVEAYAAVAVRIFVGAVAQRDHAIRHPSEVGLLGFKTVEQRLRVVRHVAGP